MKCPLCGSDLADHTEVCVNCGRPTWFVARGSRVGHRYEVLTYRGRGAAGAVYRAYDPILDEVVALKLLRVGAGEAEESERRLRREIKLARRVSHPHVCRIFDYGEDGFFRFISMEFVEGRDLRQLLGERGPLPPAEALEIVRQTAQGLEAIHRAGIIHRDLKAANVMLDAAGRVRVMDLGLAKPVEAAVSPGGAGYVVGTPEYMSPEQARGGPVGVRSDLYSLGVVLFELLTGEVPFKGETPLATLLKQIEESPPLSHERLPEDARRLLARLLAKRPEDRFASAAEVAGLLAPFESRMASLTLSLPRLPSVSRPRRAQRWQLAAATTIVAAALLAIGWPHARDPGPARAPREEGVAPVRLPETPARAPGATQPASPVTNPRSSVPYPRASPPGGPLPRPRSVVAEKGLGAPEEDTGSAAAAPVVPTQERRETSPDERATRDAAPTSEPAPEPAPPRDSGSTGARGRLQIGVRPWAEVSLDGQSLGTTPIGPLDLQPGSYTLRAVHPDYKPFVRRVRVQAGETSAFLVDLRLDAVPR